MSRERSRSAAARGRAASSRALPCIRAASGMVVLSTARMPHRPYANSSSTIASPRASEAASTCGIAALASPSPPCGTARQGPRFPGGAVVAVWGPTCRRPSSTTSASSETRFGREMSAVSAAPRLMVVVSSSSTAMSICTTSCSTRTRPSSTPEAMAAGRAADSTPEATSRCPMRRSWATERAGAQGR